MFFRTIKFKLTGWYVLILAVILSLFSIFLYVTLADSLYTGLDNKIKNTAAVIASSAARPPAGGPSMADIDRIMTQHFGIRPLGRFVQVLDESGRVGDKSTNLRNVELPVSVKTLQEATRGHVTFETVNVSGDYPLRIVTVPIVDGGRMVGIVQVGSSLEGVQEALNNLLFILLIAVPAALLVTSVGGLFLANKALKPVDGITQIARRIGSGDLSQRIRIRKINDEIGRLASTFNDMIARLEQSFQQMKRFTADASHEMKTPLTILKGEVELGLRKQRSLEEYQRILQSSLEEIDRMSRLVEDLLTLSHADSGDFLVRREDVDISRVARDVCEDLIPLANGKNVRLGSTEDGILTIYGDPLRLRQLLLNLVENGIKYTPSGGGVHITLRRHPEMNAAVLEVSDTGMGIAQEDLTRIFDRFYRVDKARSRRTGGTGLGLSICKSIAEAHGGTISVDSTQGSGTTFSVTIPLKH